MAYIHFLNVEDGDCTWIKHNSGRNTVIDICCGNIEEVKKAEAMYESVGNLHQKEHPVNPVSYLRDFNVNSIFRFILTHPDMDHMDGIKNLYNNTKFINFWDTENDKVIEEGSDYGKYKRDDWEFYQDLRDGKIIDKKNVLNLYSGAKGQYYNQDADGTGRGDGLYVLAPTRELVNEANGTGKYNDCSYVLLFRVDGKKIIFSGDSETKTWDYILEEYKEDVTDIDVLIAPHHGRKTGGNDEYLDVLNPKLTLFGNAKSKDLDYSSWNNRKLEHITNNEANCIIIKTDGNPRYNIKSKELSRGINVYVTNQKFADKYSDNGKAQYNSELKAWFLKTIW